VKLKKKPIIFLKKKQLKRMRIKLKKKLNDTFIFWQREEREKK
jgi:hypothetical protein